MRWTADGIQLTKAFVVGNEIDGWFEADGKSLVDAKYEETSAKFLMGRIRAALSVQEEISAAIETNIPFKLSLIGALNLMPRLLWESSEAVRFDIPGGLVVRNEAAYVVACPRFVLVHRLYQHLMKEFSQAKALSCHPRFPEFYLSIISHKAEQTFFSNCKLNYIIQDGEGILSFKDATFNWGQVPVGNYLVTGTALNKLDLSRRKYRKELQRHGDSLSVKLLQEMGKFRTVDVEAISTKLNSTILQAS